MNRTKSIIFSFAIFALLTLVGLAYLQSQEAPSNTTALAQNTAVPTTGGVITVIGEGRITAQPDIAQINLGIETVGSDVKTVAAETQSKMTALLEALKAQGVADRDIQTSNYSVYTERYGPMEMSQDLTYRFNNNVMITVRDLDNLETLLGVVIDAGANNIHGITFSVEDPSTLRQQARAQAVAVAESKAAELAQLNGVNVGPVVNISEVVGGYGSFPNAIAMQMDGFGGGGGPIAPGELEFTVQLQISYTIQ